MSRFLWFSVYTGFYRFGPANVTGHDINGNIIKEWGQLPPNLIPFCKKMRMMPKDALYTGVLKRDQISRLCRAERVVCAGDKRLVLGPVLRSNFALVFSLPTVLGNWSNTYFGLYIKQLAQLSQRDRAKP